MKFLCWAGRPDQHVVLQARLHIKIQNHKYISTRVTIRNFLVCDHIWGLHLQHVLSAMSKQAWTSLLSKNKTWKPLLALLGIQVIDTSGHWDNQNSTKWTRMALHIINLEVVINQNGIPSYIITSRIRLDFVQKVAHACIWESDWLSVCKHSSHWIMASI